MVDANSKADHRAKMRTMIGARRDSGEADLAPQRGVADSRRLAASVGDSPSLNVEFSGDLEELTPSVDASIHRLAQESITKAAMTAARGRTMRDPRSESDSISARVPSMPTSRAS